MVQSDTMHGICSHCTSIGDCNLFDEDDVDNKPDGSDYEGICCVEPDNDPYDSFCVEFEPEDVEE